MDGGLRLTYEPHYGDPEVTERAMGDGWFHTSDAAVVHPDGYMEIRDRIKDVITEDELTAFVRDRIAHYKVPSGVMFVTELPKTATGGIQKFVLRGGAANISRQ